jgi:hypothetical protein
MATRRKAYKTGGRIPGEPVELPDVAPDIEAAPEPAPAIEGSPVKKALDDIRRAEALQQQYAAQHQQPQQSQPNDGLTEPQRQFLKAHPHLRRDPVALMFYATRATRRGIALDSPEFFRSILDGFSREYEVGVEHAKHLAGVMSQPQRAVQEARERADEIAEKTLAMLPPEAAPAETPQAVPSPAAPRRSIPYSAPVHRDVPSASGNRDAYVDTKLSAEERDIARRSFTATDMTNEQKEYLYWLNREKLRRMRREGTYRHTTEASG